MSIRCLKETIRMTRKDHKCDLCYRVVPKGSKLLVCTCTDDNKPLYDFKVCGVCHAYSLGAMDYDDLLYTGAIHDYGIAMDCPCGDFTCYGEARIDKITNKIEFYCDKQELDYYGDTGFEFDISQELFGNPNFKWIKGVK